MYCIKSALFEAYLAWNKNHSINSGYAYTTKNIMKSLKENSTWWHPFIFDTKAAAEKFIKEKQINAIAEVI